MLYLGRIQDKDSLPVKQLPQNPRARGTIKAPDLTVTVSTHLCWLSWNCVCQYAAQTQIKITCSILIKRGEMMHLNIDWSKRRVSSVGNDTLWGGFWLYPRVHIQITEIFKRNRPHTPVWLNIINIGTPLWHWNWLFFFCLITTCEEHWRLVFWHVWCALARSA